MSEVVSPTPSEPSDAELLRRLRRTVNETYETLGHMGFGDREGLDEYGAVAMTHRHLKSKFASGSFTRLWEMGRLEISVEAIVLRPEFRELYSEDELKVARERLSNKGFNPDD
ncbi:MAG TPA: hypothetical protein VIJ34_08485 [Acidimicrobiales bacterium]